MSCMAETHVKLLNNIDFTVWKRIKTGRYFNDLKSSIR